MNYSDIGPMDASRTDEEITPNDVPDPDLSGMRVAGDYLLVRPVKTNAEKVGNVFLPDSVQGDIKYLHNVGRVLAFGPRAYKKSDDTVVEWINGGLAVGDHVQWERFVGKRLRYKGVNLVLLKDTAIQLKVEEPTDLDSMTSIEE